MNIPLEIISTIVSGCYAMFTVLLIGFILFAVAPTVSMKSMLRNVFYHRGDTPGASEAQQDAARPDPSWYFGATIMAAIVFAFGIGIEYLGDELKDLHQFPFSVAKNDTLLRSEAFKVVFSSKQPEDGDARAATANRLAECFKSQGPDGVDRISRAEKDSLNPDERECRDAVGEAQGFYYAAKNAVFQHDTYFADLKNWETRARFIRALAFTSLLLVYGLLAGTLFAIIASVAAKVSQSWRQSAAAENAERDGSLMHHYDRLHMGKLVGALLVAVMFWALTLRSGAHEKYGFYTRTFGYHKEMILDRNGG